MVNIGSGPGLFSSRRSRCATVRERPNLHPDGPLSVFQRLSTQTAKISPSIRGGAVDGGDVPIVVHPNRTASVPCHRLPKLAAERQACTASATASGWRDVPSECQQCLGRLKTVHFIEGSVQGRFATAGGTPWPAVLRACIQTSPPQEEQRWSFEPGQSDLDASTAQGTVGDRDRPVVVDDDLLHDRQAEARPALVSGSCGV